MNNLKDSGAFWAAKGIAEPRIVVNADTGVTSAITKRAGKTLLSTLVGAHSLWAGTSCMLVAAANTLYRVESGGALTSIDTIDGPDAPVSYEEANDKVYISNAYWSSIYDPATAAVTDWGISLPVGPMLLRSTAGNLQPGKYHVTFTQVVSDELSGNGPIADITLEEEGGITLLNRPAGALVWATDENEPIFYLVGAVDKIVDIPTVEPLPSFLCSPPPKMSNLCYGFGRMWGGSDNVLYYSEPYELGWFKPAANYFEFDSEITMIARVATGLFIGMADKTKFLAGTEPHQMTEHYAGAGSIAGTLAYANNLPELGDVLGTPEKGFVDVPVWRTTDGVVAGNVSGRLYNLTKHKLRMGVPERGASLYRNLNGVFQFLTSAARASGGSGVGLEDAETVTVFRNEGVAQSNAYPGGTVTLTGLSDTAECEVRRGGELI